MSGHDPEFTVLRQTIATRGTVRMALVPATVIGWAAISVALLRFQGTVIAPALSLISLGVLVAGFEAIHALHVGVERIGRYLQVYYEREADGPRWETTAMATGPALPGGGIDPLFAVVFIVISLLNLTMSFLSWQTRLDALVAVPHVLFWARVVRARAAAARQRAVDLETFRAIREQTH
jgi:hypothetical protein